MSEPEVCYTHYPNGSVRSIVERRTKDGVIMESFKTFHPNGSVARQGMSVNGKAQGVLRTYYPSGIVESEFTFENGNSSGIQRYFFENGELKESISMVNGRLEGPRSFYGRNGEHWGTSVITNGSGIDCYWSADGELISACPQKNGVPHGVDWSRLGDGSFHVNGYFIKGKKVPKQKFLGIASRDTDLFEGVPDELYEQIAVEVKQRSKSAFKNQPNPLRLVISNSNEVLSFLRQPGTWTLGELGSKQESLDLAAGIYELGASLITVHQITEEPEGGSVSQLVIRVDDIDQANDIAACLEEYGIIVDVNHDFDLSTGILSVQLD